MRPDKMEQDALLEIYREHYSHARHEQQVRATYLYLYFIIVGGTFAALIGVLAKPEASQAIRLVGAILWVLSMLLVWRSELLSSHVTHCLVIVRKINQLLAERHPALSDPLGAEGSRSHAFWSRLKAQFGIGDTDGQGDWQEPSRFLAFRRLPFDPNKSIETPVGMIGALVASIMIASQIQAGFDLIRVLVVLAGFLPVLALWRILVVSYEDRHRGCCLRPEYQLPEFKLPSRFTFIDRHMMAFAVAKRFLAIRRPLSILDIGPGVFEPFVLGSALTGNGGSAFARTIGRIDAVEPDDALAEMLRQLTARRAVSMRRIATESTNIDDDGYPVSNTDLEKDSRLTQQIDALERAGVTAREWFPNGNRSFQPSVGFEVAVSAANAKTYLSGIGSRKYDFAFLGAVLLNVRKSSSSDEVKGIISGLHASLRRDATLCVTTTPSEFLQPDGPLSWLMDGGFRLVCAFPERLVLLRKRGAAILRGDIALILRNASQRRAPVEAEVCSQLLDSLHSHVGMRSRAAANWHRSAVSHWRDFWIPVGWTSYPSPGTEILFDLDALWPSGRLEFAPPEIRQARSAHP